MQSNNILENLNPQQKEAVQNYKGPCLIVAGAGSGKTKVLTSRIAYMVSEGVDPGRILALTFTKKAAEEMKERIGVMIGYGAARHLNMGTFHSVFCKILREFHEAIGYERDFTIYDTSATKSAITSIVKEMELDAKVYDVKKITSRISMAKNNFVTAKVYNTSPKVIEEDAQHKMPLIGEIYKRYSDKCRSCNVMDFDDILLNLDILVQTNEIVTKAIADKFDYILVDEYQDTNFAQYFIIQKLAQWKRNICVVGDDSQSIYAFRGATIDNILKFKKDYPECNTYRLERNYRSTKTIVRAANSLIAHNNNRIPKECFSEGEEGAPIDLIASYDEKEEALLLTSAIVVKMAQQKAAYSDFAILYRTNAQSRAIEEELRHRNIPYVIYSGRSFYEREEVMDLLAYFRLVVNPFDDEAFKRVCNKPTRGISAATLAKLSLCATALGTSLFKAAYSEEFATKYDLRESAITSVRKFCDLINSLAAKQSTTDAFTLAQETAGSTSYYSFRSEDKSAEGLAKLGNVDELLSGVKSFVNQLSEEFAAIQLEENDTTEVNQDELPVITLSSYLENVALLSAVDIDEDSTNKVALMTVHASKGLEFANVFVTGLEEELFPSGGFLISPLELEEERRLMYVAMTRAEKTLTLSFAKKRFRRGITMANSPSRFIKEIPVEYYSRTAQRSLGGSGVAVGSSYSSGFGGGSSYGSGSSRPSTTPQYSRPSQPSRPSAPAPAPASAPNPSPDDMHLATISELRPGVQVHHGKFGFGTITEVQDNGMLKVVVRFDAYGLKTLIPSYAKLMVK